MSGNTPPSKKNQKVTEWKERVEPEYIYQRALEYFEDTKGQPLNMRESVVLREALSAAYDIARKPLNEMGLLDKVIDGFYLRYFDLVHVGEIPGIKPIDIGRNGMEAVIRKFWHEKLVKENKLPSSEDDEVPDYIRMSRR